MQTTAHNMGREERRALLEQRRAAVARQLRRLAIELTNLDSQLDDIKQSERSLRRQQVAASDPPAGEDSTDESTGP